MVPVVCSRWTCQQYGPQFPPFTLAYSCQCAALRTAVEAGMTNSQIEAVAAEVKSLKARMAALEKLLERILRQKPVSEKQLEKALRARNLISSDMHG